ncbi:hypothetical protein [Devosia sp.]|uniref:hypothetical protein n=1 Tax=Devosia sp. TaxID=1871048 RepID=UPI002AFFDA86|nr:hypothetical protein [Devosia sp.]
MRKFISKWCFHRPDFTSPKQNWRTTKDRRLFSKQLKMSNGCDLTAFRPDASDTRMSAMTYAVFMAMSGAQTGFGESLVGMNILSGRFGARSRS